MASVIIIGGGALGMLSARELALAGASVAIVERGPVAMESSWAGGGIISPLYPWRYLDSITRLASWSQAAYPAIASALLQDNGIDSEYLPGGLLIHAPGEEITAVDWASRHGQQVEVVDRDTIRRLEPARENPPDKMLWMPNVHQVRNPRLTRALLADITRLGVKTFTHQPVEKLLFDNQRLTGVVTAGQHHQADNVLVCAGAWSGDFLRDTLPAPDIRPVRGQMILFKGQPGAISRIVLEENRYVIPRQDGRVLFGSTIEEAGFDKSTTRAAYDELYQLVTRRFPVLKRFEVEKHWAGLRPGSPAGVPYIARHPDYSNLFINAGHFRNGLVLGPASARLASDLILERSPSIDPAPYSLTAARG